MKWKWAFWIFYLKTSPPSQFSTLLNRFIKKPKKKVKRIRGYSINLNHKDINDIDSQSRNSKIQDII